MLILLIGSDCKIPREIAHMCNVCNGQILQLDLRSKINFYGIETESSYIHTEISDP